MHCFVNFRSEHFTISKFVGISADAVILVIHPRRVSCLFCIRMCMYCVCRQINRIPMHFYQQKLVEHSLALKKLWVKSLMELFFRQRGTNFTQVKAILYEIWSVYSAKSIIIKYLFLSRVRPSKIFCQQFFLWHTNPTRVYNTSFYRCFDNTQFDMRKR